MSISTNTGYNSISYGGKAYHVYKIPATNRIGFGLSQNTSSYLSSNTLVPDGVANSRCYAKTNCSFFSSSSPYLGVHYTGGKVYCNSGGPITNITGSSTLANYFSRSSATAAAKHYPALCLSNGVPKIIRWFNSVSDFSANYTKYSTIISAGTVLVYKGNNVFTTMTTDAEYGNKIAPSSLSTDSPEYHYQTGFAEPNTAAARTMFGFTSAGVSFMVVTKSLNSIKADTAAALMKELGCYYAAFLDGGLSSEMHEKSVYTENWSSVYTSTRKKQTALFAYQP